MKPASEYEEATESVWEEVSHVIHGNDLDNFMCLAFQGSMEEDMIRDYHDRDLHGTVVHILEICDCHWHEAMTLQDARIIWSLLWDVAKIVAECHQEWDLLHEIIDDLAFYIFDNVRNVSGFVNLP